MSTQQKVFRLKSRTGIDNLTLHDEEMPQAAAYEVVIKVRSVALNFRDIAIAHDQYPLWVKDDLIPGSDAAGEIVEVGPQVVGLSVGDSVVATFNPYNLYGTVRDHSGGLGGAMDGVLRTYLPIAASAVVKIPQGSSLKPSQWAALVCTGTTVWNALYGSTQFKPGQSILFMGTGGVSMTGLVFAKAIGAKTIITSSSDEKLAQVKEKYGVDHTINYKTHPEWSKEVLRITGGQGVDHILENGGSGTILQSIQSIKLGGVISVIGFLSAAKKDEMPDVAGLALSKACIVRGILVGSKQLLEECVEFAGHQNLDIPVAKTFPFTEEGVKAAYACLAGAQQVGKVCIDFD